MRAEPRQSEVKKAFEYCNGMLIRKSTGKRGYISPSGYIYVRMNGFSYLEHQLIFLMHMGYLPKQIDHKNRDKSDNRIENLREASQSENAQNKVVGSGESGFLGVSWSKHAKKWKAKIGINGKHIHIGYFEKAEEASAAYMREKKKIHSFADI